MVLAIISELQCLDSVGRAGAEAGPQLQQDITLGLSLELETVSHVERLVYAFKALSSQNSFGPKSRGFQWIPTQSRMMSSCPRQSYWI